MTATCRYQYSSVGRFWYSYFCNLGVPGLGKFKVPGTGRTNGTWYQVPVERSRTTTHIPYRVRVTKRYIRTLSGENLTNTYWILWSQARRTSCTQGIVNKLICSTNKYYYFLLDTSLWIQKEWVQLEQNKHGNVFKGSCLSFPWLMIKMYWPLIKIHFELLWLVEGLNHWPKCHLWKLVALCRHCWLESESI